MIGIEVQIKDLKIRNRTRIARIARMLRIFTDSDRFRADTLSVLILSIRAIRVRFV